MCECVSVSGARVHEHNNTAPTRPTPPNRAEGLNFILREETRPLALLVVPCYKLKQVALQMN